MRFTKKKYFEKVDRNFSDMFDLHNFHKLMLSDLILVFYTLGATSSNKSSAAGRVRIARTISREAEVKETSVDDDDDGQVSAV